MARLRGGYLSTNAWRDAYIENDHAELPEWCEYAICAEYIYEHIQNSYTVHVAIFINIIYRYMYNYYIYILYI